jgi:type VI secretion system protein ImpC
MKNPISFGSLGVELVSSMHDAQSRPAQDAPFRICILGDFSGRTSRGVVEPLRGRAPVPVDRDNVDEVLGRMNVRLRLESAGEGLDVSFAGLDDFHPDHLFRRIGVFKALRDVRDRLQDTRTFQSALKVLQGITGETGQVAVQDREPQPSPSGSLLDLMMGEASAGGGKEGAGSPDMDAFLAAVVRPHLVAREDPEQARLTAVLDRIVSDLMAEVMHHPSFQALEASWRGVQFLCSRTETDETLQICLLDISARELASDLSTHEDLSRTCLYRLLVEDAREKPWAVLIGDYAFGHQDAYTLGRMARVAAAAGAPFIARAEPSLVGCMSLEGNPDPASWKSFPDPETLAAWDDLRHLKEAAYLGLVMPRFLLRLPFGRETDAAETFDFEETAEGAVHEHYLWGNPAYACAYLLARSFVLDGWDMRPGSALEVDSLPLHVYQEGGASVLKPCAEIALTEAAADAIMDAGIMPLATIRDTDTARLVRFQSLAEPSTALAGRWGPH